MIDKKTLENASRSAALKELNLDEIFDLSHRLLKQRELEGTAGTIEFMVHDTKENRRAIRMFNEMGGKMVVT